MTSLPRENDAPQPHSRSEHHVLGVLPLTITLYAANGRVLLRSTGLREGASVPVPKDMRKRVARTETMDARGKIIDRWVAPWAVDA